MTVGIQQTLKVGNLLFQFGSYVGVGHQHPALRHLYDVRGTAYVKTLLYGIGGTGERLMLHELESAAVIYERVASYACLLVVCR